MANYVYATDPRKPIPIGVQGENGARTVVFDIHKWIEDYGNGTPLLVHQRPGDAEPYPVTTAQKAGTVEWTVQQADIIAGAPGRAQLSYQVGDNIVARSPIYMTVAADEITNTPLADYDPAKSWIDDLLDAVNKAGDITSDVQAAQTAATQAGQSATAAAGSASDAEESATAAASSAAQAAQHAGEVTSGVQAAAQSATQAAGSAADAAESASQAASSASAAQEAAESAQEYSGKPPIIQNDTWWTWDAITQAYQDTGTQATGDQGKTGGFGQPTIEVDDTTGTPEASVTATGPDTEKIFHFSFSGLKGETGLKGDTGEAAGFGEITATVDNAVGAPEVEVETSGDDTAKNITFNFKNMKGEPGTAAGIADATATVDGTTGVPEVTVSTTGPDTAKQFAFAFSGLKGNTGEAAGFGSVTATVDDTVGTPSVTVTPSGDDTAKNFAFAFSNLKGEPGRDVDRVARTSGTGAPGTTDTYTMYDSDDAPIGTFNVYNGADGAGSGDFKADGSVPMTGDLNAGGHRVTNVGAPTAASDAVRQLDLQAVSDEIDAIIAGTTPVNIPVATDVKAGIIMPGEHLSVTADGTLNAEWPDLSGYLTEIPAEYVTSTELAGYGYITADTLDGYATQSWVNGRGFLTAVPDEYVTSTELTEALGDYVTADMLTGYGYITSTALIGYATESWVQGQGYLTAVPAEYITEDELSAKGYLTAVPAEYVTESELTSKGYATMADVAETYAEKGFTWTGTLKASGWSGSAVPYTQTLTISGMQATDNPFLGPNYTSTDVDTVKGQEEAFSLIGRIDSGAGNITVYIYEDSKPEVDIPILVKVVR